MRLQKTVQADPLLEVLLADCPRRFPRLEVLLVFALALGLLPVVVPCWLSWRSSSTLAAARAATRPTPPISLTNSRRV